MVENQGPRRERISRRSLAAMGATVLGHQLAGGVSASPPELAALAASLDHLRLCAGADCRLPRRGGRAGQCCGKWVVAGFRKPILDPGGKEPVRLTTSERWASIAHDFQDGWTGPTTSWVCQLMTQRCRVDGRIIRVADEVRLSAPSVGNLGVERQADIVPLGHGAQRLRHFLSNGREFLAGRGFIPCMAGIDAASIAISPARNASGSETRGGQRERRHRHVAKSARVRASRVVRRHPRGRKSPHRRQAQMALDGAVQRRVERVAIDALEDADAHRPPGASTRRISARAASRSAKNMSANWLTTRSKRSSGKGSSSARHSCQAIINPSWAAATRAMASMSGLESRAATVPSGPTRGAASRATMPVPVPISSTRSPGRGRATSSNARQRARRSPAPRNARRSLPG